MLTVDRPMTSLIQSSRELRALVDVVIVNARSQSRRAACGRRSLQLLHPVDGAQFGRVLCRRAPGRSRPPGPAGRCCLVALQRGEYVCRRADHVVLAQAVVGHDVVLSGAVLLQVGAAAPPGHRRVVELVDAVVQVAHRLVVVAAVRAAESVSTMASAWTTTLTT